MGNRNIPWWAVLASILAAEISAATFLGAPGEGYEKRNFTYAQLALGTILARVIIAYVFIKPYYDFRVVSIYEYLLLRFGIRTKDTASAIFLITRALASGTRLYVAAIVFVMGYEMVTGETLNIWQQVWIYIIALTAITALTALYTALGGIKAVVWTDVIQACIMFGSLGFAIWSLLHAIPGGWQGVTANAQPTGRLAVLLERPGAGKKLLGQCARHPRKRIHHLGRAHWIHVHDARHARHGSGYGAAHAHSKGPSPQPPVADSFGLCGSPSGAWRFFLSESCFGHFTSSRARMRHLPITSSTSFRRVCAGCSSQAFLPPRWVRSAPRSMRSPPVSPRIGIGPTSARTPLKLRSFARRASARSFSRCCSILIGSATAYAKIVLNARIIPIVLGIFGYTYGSLLGVFLVGLLTKRRGSEAGNLFAMICGFLVVAVLSGLHNDLWTLLHPAASRRRPSRRFGHPPGCPGSSFPGASHLARS